MLHWTLAHISHCSGVPRRDVAIKRCSSREYAPHRSHYSGPRRDVAIKGWCPSEHAIHISNCSSVPRRDVAIEGWCSPKHVTHMSHMFRGASSFNGDISSWNTSAVFKMDYMFYGASSFNQNLCAWKDNNRFPYSNSDAIFAISGCTYQGNPQVGARGPFCASSCTLDDMQLNLNEWISI